MDGIIAMEGNGPFSGKARQMNVLLFSTDPIALDSIACKMIDLNPEFVPTSKPGEKSGLGTYHYENIEVIGDESRFIYRQEILRLLESPRFCHNGRFERFLQNQLTPRPVIDRAKCTRCGTCIKSVR